jgi:hypothetical protein
MLKLALTLPVLYADLTDKVLLVEHKYSRLHFVTKNIFTIWNHDIQYVCIRNQAII